MRMQNVKIGKYLDDEGQNISDVEAVLSSMGIKLREDNDTWRDFSEVLDEVMIKWEELGAEGKTAEQSLLVQTFAGQRQANILTDLLNNQDKYNEALGVEAEALGTTESRYKIYTDNIEASINRFTAAWEAMWSKTISDDLIKDIVDFGTGVLDLINKLGGLVPVLGAIAAVLIVINRESILTTISGFLNMIPSVISGIGIWTQSLFGLAAAENGVTTAATAMAASTAIATAGISIAVAAIVLLIANADKLGNSMTNLYDKFKEAEQIASSNESELNSLASEYETLSAKTDKTADDLTRLLDIQTILNTKYGYSTDGVNAYTAAIDGNSEAIQENIRWMKEKALQEAQSFVSEKKAAYEEAKKYLGGKTWTTYSPTKDVMAGTPEEIIEGLREYISTGEDASGTAQKMLEYWQEQVNTANELIIDYEHYSNVIEANTAVANENADANSNVSALFSSLVSNIDAASSAMQEQSENGELSFATMQKLIGAGLIEYLYQENGAWKLNTQAMIADTTVALNKILAEQGLTNVLAMVAAGEYKTAYATLAAMASRGESITQAMAYVSMLQNMADSLNSVASGAGGASSAVNEINESIKNGYEIEIAALEKRKKALDKQKDALEDQKKAYKAIIDAMKEKLRLAKEEEDYQDELKHRNKEIVDIDDQLLALQFDNSEEANRKRLELEAERAEKTEELNEYQADRTYDIQIEALDREYEAFAAMIDKQIAGIDKMIDKFDDMIDKINEAIDALSDLASAGTGGGGGGGVSSISSGTVGGGAPLGTVNKKIKGGGGARNIVNLQEEYHDGGIVGDIPKLKSTEQFAKLLKGEVVGNESQITNFMNDTLPNLIANYGGSSGIGDIEINFNVAGSMDKSIIPAIKDMVFSEILKASRIRGKKSNAFSFSV